MQSVTSNAVAEEISNMSEAISDVSEDSKVLLHTEKIGSYTLASGQTMSFKINSAVPSAPSGYTRYTYVYASLQNFCQTSVNFVESDIYVTMTNHFTETLTYDLYAFVLFFRCKII